MWKRIAFDRHAAVFFSVATAAMTGSAASVAGPGCMGNPQQPLVRNYYPYGPMMPQASLPTRAATRVPYPCGALQGHDGTSLPAATACSAE